MCRETITFRQLTSIFSFSVSSSLDELLLIRPRQFSRTQLLTSKSLDAQCFLNQKAVIRNSLPTQTCLRSIKHLGFSFVLEAYICNFCTVTTNWGYCLKNKNLTITIWLWLAYPVTFHFFHKAVLINVEEFAATGRVSKVTCLPIGSFMSTIKRVVIRMSVWAHNLFWTSDALHMQLHAQSCNTVYKILLQITQLLK